MLGINLSGNLRYAPSPQPIISPESVSLAQHLHPPTISARTHEPFPLGVWEGSGGEAFIGRMQPFILTLESGAESGKEKIVHTGSEFVMCIRGKLEYKVEREFYTLEAGDSLLFAALLTHRWRNPGNMVANAILVLSGFGEYESPGIYHHPPDVV